MCDRIVEMKFTSIEMHQEVLSWHVAPSQATATDCLQKRRLAPADAQTYFKIGLKDPTIDSLGLQSSPRGPIESPQSRMHMRPRLREVIDGRIKPVAMLREDRTGHLGQTLCRLIFTNILRQKFINDLQLIAFNCGCHRKVLSWKRRCEKQAGLPSEGSMRADKLRAHDFSERDCSTRESIFKLLQNTQMFNHILILGVIGLWTGFIASVIVIAYYYNKTDSPSKVQPKILVTNISEQPNPVGGYSFGATHSTNAQNDPKVIMTEPTVAEANKLNPILKKSRFVKESEEAQESPMPDMSDTSSNNPKKSRAELYGVQGTNPNNRNVYNKAGKQPEFIQLPNRDVISTSQTIKKPATKHNSYLSMQQTDQQYDQIQYEPKSIEMSPKSKRALADRKQDKRTKFQLQEEEPRERDVYKCHQLSKAMEKLQPNLSRYFQILLIYFRNLQTLLAVGLMLKFGLKEISIHIIYPGAVLFDLILRQIDSSSLRQMKQKAENFIWRFIYYLLWLLTSGLAVYLLTDQCCIDDVEWVILYLPSITLDMIILDPAKYLFKKWRTKRREVQEIIENTQRINVLKILNSIK